MLLCPASCTSQGCVARVVATCSLATLWPYQYQRAMSEGFDEIGGNPYGSMTPPWKKPRQSSQVKCWASHGAKAWAALAVLSGTGSCRLCTKKWTKDHNLFGRADNLYAAMVLFWTQFGVALNSFRSASHSASVLIL